MGQYTKLDMAFTAEEMQEIYAEATKKCMDDNKCSLEEVVANKRLSPYILQAMHAARTAGKGIKVYD